MFKILPTCLQPAPALYRAVRFRFVFSFLFPLSAFPAHLFILSGQSNMARLDSARSFTPAVEAAFGAENVVVIKDAQGGQPIRRWLVPEIGDRSSEMGDLYKRLMGKVLPVVGEREFQTVTFVWMQGERDAGEGNADRYGDDLLWLVRQLEADLDRDDLYVVIGRLSDFDLENEYYRHWTRIRQIQENLAEARLNWTWVDTDPYNGPHDGLHHTAKGYDALGWAFAEAAVDLAGGGERGAGSKKPGARGAEFGAEDVFEGTE